MRSFWGFLLAVAIVGGAVVYKAETSISGVSAEKHESEEAEPDSPDKAYAWRRLAWLSEDGTIPHNAYWNAMDQRAEIVGNSARDLNTGIPWVFRGPGNVGGRTRSLVIDPTNRNHLIAGAVGGGIWNSYDAGASWQKVNDFLPSLAIGCMTYDRNNSNVVYAGLGEGYFNGDAVEGSGILRSKDNGQTWAILPSTKGFGNTCRIAVQPGNSNVILAGTRYSGIQRSTDGGQTWTNPYWAQACYDVQFHPTNPNLAIAALLDYDWGVGDWFGSAMYSTDGGQTWTRAGGLGQKFGFGSRVELAYSKSSPNVVYGVCGADGGKVWKSLDGGQNYTVQTTSGTTGTNWYCAPIWVDPTNPSVLATGGYVGYWSSNGGITMTQKTDGYIMTTTPHPDMHWIVSDPGFNGTTNRRVYVCTDGSIYRTDNFYTANTSSGWVRCDFGYQTTQYYGAVGDGPTDRLVGGTQDNGTHTINGANTTAYLTYGGDGGFCAIDSTDPNYIYGEYVGLTMFASHDGGLSAGNIYGGLTDAGSDANFISPFILDPNNQSRMLAGGGQLWVSSNIKSWTPTWASIRPRGSEVISAIAVAKTNSNVMWVAQNDGKIQMTTNGLAATPTWTDIDNNGAKNPLPNRYVTRIVIDPQTANRVYVTLGGWANDDVWRTTDGGASWTNIGSGLPAAPVRGFARHPQNPNRLYAGTEVGLFTTADGGQTWSTSDSGPAAVAIYEVNFLNNSNKLILATHGRGLWTAEVPNPAGLVRGTVTLGDFQPALAGQVVTVEFRPVGSNSVTASKTMTLGAAGAYSLDPDVPTGTYDMYVKGSHWLAKKRASLTIGTGVIVNVNFSLLNGDVDGDNVVTIFDYLALSTAFDTSAGDALFDANADLDGDGTVSIFDYVILSGNFDKSGD
ncbi:MAG: hypothetical protein JST40_04935 [Armatimonadetes bacterium]|nr:hypothetical protein [Armatimonadota bacterium]